MCSFPQRASNTGVQTLSDNFRNNIDTRTIVPIGGVKLGLNYASLTSMGQLSLEGGYFANAAFRVVHAAGTLSTTVPLPAPNRSFDFALHGPYLTAKLDTSVV